MTIQNGYTTLNDLKQFISVGTADTIDDTMYEMAIESASRMIDDDCDRVFYASGTAVARVFVPDSSGVTQISDAISVAAVATDEDGSGAYSTVWSASDYQLEPLNGLLGGQPWPYTRIRAIGNYTFPSGPQASVKVTGQWGFGTAVPTAIEQATLFLASRVRKRGDSPLGAAGFGDMGVMRVSRSDPDYVAAIDRFIRVKIATA